MPADSPSPSIAPGLGPLRDPPVGLPDVDLAPPVVAETGDPFTTVRVIALLARLERGRPIRLADVCDRLNATHLDWLFDERVVGDAIVQLQANWMADYRNTSGIVVDEVDGRVTISIEDSSRVDPWIVRQATRLGDACREELRAFSLRDRATGE